MAEPDGIEYSPIALCNIEDVKRIIDPKLSGVADNLLILLINGLSKSIEQYCNRLFEKKTYEEFFNGYSEHFGEEPRSVGSVVVHAPPIAIDETLEVWDDPNLAFSDNAYKLVRDSDYTLYARGASGVVRLIEGRCFNTGYGNIKVKYNGGFVLHTIDDLIVPDDLRLAAAMQASYLYKTRDNMGVSGLTAVGGTVTLQQTPTRWLPAVREIIDTYRMFWI